RSISLAAISAGNPDFHLLLRPVRAFAAHPVLEANAAIVTLGIEAETRIVPSATQPDCSFPTALEIVPPVNEGRFAIATPIGTPFTEIHTILNRQLRNRTFPESADAWAQATVLRTHVAASGDRLLVAIIIRAREETTWFGIGARATLYVWVRPVLDNEQQKL